VRLAVRLLNERSDIGVVGGAQVPIAPPRGVIAAGIARSLSNRYTTGLSRYRRSTWSGPADTVWMGCFRTADLRAIGGWDPEHGVNEDYELNQRLRSAGFLVWFHESMGAGYVPRRELRELGRQYYAFGRSKGSQWASGSRPSPRHFVVLAVPPFALAGLAACARRCGPPTAITASTVALAALDHFGARSVAAPPLVRATSVASTLTFAMAWWIGVITGWLHGS
jgi:hypothetical protein